MYFWFFKLKKWDKKTAETRRRNCAVLPKFPDTPEKKQPLPPGRLLLTARNRPASGNTPAHAFVPACLSSDPAEDSPRHFVALPPHKCGGQERCEAPSASPLGELARRSRD